jgi:lipopolysaccharide heptosyltransferase I
MAGADRRDATHAPTLPAGPAPLSSCARGELTAMATEQPTPEPPRRVLIVLLGAIGDVVRALPLLGRIRRAWPRAHIAWAIEPKSLPILEHHSWLDEIILYDRTRAPLAFSGYLRRVRAGRFDLVVDLQRHLKSGITSVVSGAPDRIGFAAPNTKEFNHLFSTRTIAPQPAMKLKLMQYQAFGDALGLATAPIEFGLSPTDDERARVNELLRDAPRPLMGVILGSSWPSRIYFPELTARAIATLSAANNGGAPLYPVLIGTPEEAPLADDVMRHLDGAPALNLAGKTGLRDLIALFGECTTAFGPDSGPMHIAAAVGCPIVSLWGSTAPQRSAPWGFDQYAIVGEIPCHPCYLRSCPIGRECMWRIDPAVVAERVRRAAREPAGAPGARAEASG